MDEPVIKMSDAYECGFCVRGTRTWCELRGIDFKKFVKDGYPISEAEKFNDALLNRVIERKKQSLSDG